MQVFMHTCTSVDWEQSQWFENPPSGLGREARDEWLAGAFGES